MNFLLARAFSALRMYSRILNGKSTEACDEARYCEYLNTASDITVDDEKLEVPDLRYMVSPVTTYSILAQSTEELLLLRPHVEHIVKMCKQDRRPLWTTHNIDTKSELHQAVITRQ